MDKMIKFRFLIVIVMFFITHSGFAQPVAEKSPTAKLSEAVQKILNEKKDLIEKEVAESPAVIEEVKIHNEKNKNLSSGEIQKIDQEWIASKKVVADFMKEFLTEPIAEFLISFQESHEGFAEIFMTDARGLMVAMTNKTSDYLQSDEDWWVKCYANGQGLAYYGNIEYDESAMSESIAVFVPIKDPQDNKAVGVIKAVIDISAIQRELE